MKFVDASGRCWREETSCEKCLDLDISCAWCTDKVILFSIHYPLGFYFTEGYSFYSNTFSFYFPNIFKDV